MDIMVGSVMILTVLGIVFGVGLALASKRLAVHVDAKVEAIDSALPQLNCAACGFPGCLDYAKALARGGISPSLCVPGQQEVAATLSQITGLPLEEVKPVRAFVHCQGGLREARDAFEYHGEEDCRAAVLVHGGPKQCKYGCLGFGTCRRVCPYAAVTMTEDRLPLVDLNRCTGCGLCVKACPTQIIETLPLETKVYLGCSSLERGLTVKKKCSVGCISCRICARVTTSGAIIMEEGDALPRMDYGKGHDFEAACSKCPMHCFVKTTPTCSVDLKAQEVIRAREAPRQEASVL